jgi:hypothetical protein
MHNGSERKRAGGARAKDNSGGEQDICTAAAMEFHDRGDWAGEHGRKISSI